MKVYDAKELLYEHPDGTDRIYKTDTDVILWDVTIDAGIDDEVYVAHISDLHLNYCNEQDFAEADPVLMSTYEHRVYLRDGLTVPNTRNCVAMVQDADAHVFNGDTLDFLSHGTMELMDREVWDKFPDCIATVGGHEFARQMQGVVAETLSREERLKILESYWRHDIYYTSKVIKNKVMLVGFMNDCGRQTAEQTKQLKADLQRARENGWVVLLFAHEPIVTNNPAHASFPAEGDVLFEGNGGGRTLNYYNGSLPGGSDADNESREFYDVIYNSADVIKGFFAGHWHDDYKLDISAKTPSGETALIPQFVHAASYVCKGHCMRILVK